MEGGHCEPDQITYPFPVSSWGTWLYRSALGFSLASASWSASAADDICSQLSVFHSAPFDQTVQPAGRRWVELHWRGHWLDLDKGFGKECRSSPDAASKALCRWITVNSSREFPALLPMRMLHCFGYQFPRGAGNEWDNWRSNVSILSESRWLLLEIDLVPSSTDDGVIRLSSFVKDKDQWIVEMPSLSNDGSSPKE